MPASDGGWIGDDATQMAHLALPAAVVSAPHVREPKPGNMGVVGGTFTEVEARALAAAIGGPPGT